MREESIFMRKPLSSFLAALTLLGSLGFGEVNADSRVDKRYAPPAKHRKVEGESDEGLSTPDKISIGALAVCGTFLLAAAGKFIWDSKHDDESASSASSPNSNPHLVGISNPGNACYINSIMQVLFRNRQLREYVLSHNGGNQQLNDLKMVFEKLRDHILIDAKTIGRIYRESFGYTGRQNDPTVVINTLGDCLNTSGAGYDNFNLLVYPNIENLSAMINPPAFNYRAVSVPDTRNRFCTDDGRNICAQFGAELLKMLWFDRREILRRIKDVHGIDYDEERNFVRINNVGQEQFKAQIQAYQMVDRSAQKKFVGQDAFDRYKRDASNLKRSDMYKLFTPLLVCEMVNKNNGATLYNLLCADSNESLLNLIPEGQREGVIQQVNGVNGQTAKQKIIFDGLVENDIFVGLGMEYYIEMAHFIPAMQRQNAHGVPGARGIKGSEFGLTGTDANRRFFACQGDYEYLVNRIFSGKTKTALANMTLEGFQNLFQSQQEVAFMEAQLPTGDAEQFMVTINRNLDVAHLHALVTADPQMYIGDVNYTWTAAIVHSGDQNGGHYYTYAMDNQRRWWCYNDSHVTRVEDIDTARRQIIDQNGTQFIYTRTNLLNGSYFPN